MSLVSPTQVSDGTTADASDVNTPINQLAAVINGNIDNSNIVAGAAIDGSKLANSSIDIGAKASVFDGWVGVTDSWTYASATTVTVPSDATTKYAPGDKVKFSNGSTKYFTIQTVASTLLTFTGGSDTVANSAISAIYYSKVDTPQTFPGPANPYKFSVYASGNTSITNTTQKVVLNTERFDTNNNFDSSTNYRYTAPVTGFYQLSAQVGLGSAGAGTGEYGYLMIYKNNAELVRSEMIPGVGSANLLPRPHISILVSLTAGDYLELWCNYTGSRDIVGGSNISWFTGFLVSRT